MLDPEWSKIFFRFKMMYIILYFSMSNSLTRRFDALSYLFIRSLLSLQNVISMIFKEVIFRFLKNT